MMSFKPGDRVRIRADVPLFAGFKGTVMEITQRGSVAVTVDDPPSGYPHITGSFFEPEELEAEA